MSSTKSDIGELKTQMGVVSQKIEKLEEENLALKEEIKCLKEERNTDRRELRRLSEAAKSKNVLVKGLSKDAANKEGISKLCRENLMLSDVRVCDTRIVFENKKSVGVVAELESSGMAKEVLQNSKKLAGSSIFVERDLCEERRTRKKVLLQLKKVILAADRSKKVFVKNDTVNVNGKWMSFDNRNVLVCEGQPAERVLKDIYGDSLNLNLLKYDILLQHLNVKKTK